MGAAHDKEFFDELVKLTEKYEPDLVCMLNTCLTILNNVFAACDSEEEIGFYVTRIRCAIDQIESSETQRVKDKLDEQVRPRILGV